MSEALDPQKPLRTEDKKEPTALPRKPLSVPLDPGVQEITHRDLLDTDTLRQSIFSRVKDAYAAKVIEDEGHRMEFADVDYRNPREFSLRDEKDAVMGRSRLYHALQGRIRFIDKATGEVVAEDEKPRTLAQVPYVTKQGLFVNNGSQYLVPNQSRLRPGVYTRRQQNGGIETQFNTKPGTGRGFRLGLEPETGIFKMSVGQAHVKLYPVLRDMGVSDRDLEEAWGRDLLNVNRAADDKNSRVSTRKVLDRLGRVADKTTDATQAPERLKEVLARMELDPQVTKRTMGQPIANVTTPTLLQATQKLLAVGRGEADPDQREALSYQEFLTPDDFFVEHVNRDAGNLQRQAFYKLRYHQDTKKTPVNFFGNQLKSVLLSAKLAAPLTEVNPVEILDQRRKIVRTGEGGIGNLQSVTDEMRNIHPTHFGFIDPIRAPESDKIGLDMRLATGVSRGSDGKLYQEVVGIDGVKKRLSTDDFYDQPVAFPGEFARLDLSTKRPSKKVRAMVGGKMRYVPRSEVQYELPDPGSMFTEGTNLVPIIGAGKGQRTLMGARMQSQALALRNPDAPLVQTAYPGRPGETFHSVHGKDMGAIRSQAPGTVVKVTTNSITVRQADGTKKEHDLYDYMPYNQKSVITSTPTVKKGDVVEPGQLLATSNFTDAQGNIALGRNARVGYHMMDGMTHEDAAVMSESAARHKFASQQLYNTVAERGDDIAEISRNAYLSKFPGRFTEAQTKEIDADGVIKPGALVRPGDPLVLALGTPKARVAGALMKGAKNTYRDSSIVWDHHEQGVVTDVAKTGKGYNVAVLSYTPLKEGDKVANNYGGKGIISRVLPDDEMPVDEEGQPLDLVLNPFGINSRTNPNQIIESRLAKIAAKTGKPYILPGIGTEDLAQFAWDEMQKHGMKDTETLIDPRTGRKIPEVFTGVQQFYKLHHMAEGKLSGRADEGYTAEGLPAKGGKHGAKRVDTLGVFALLSHGATEVLRDAKMRRGQNNDDYWRTFSLGMTPHEPKISKAYQKFEAHLKGAGVQLRKKGTKTQIMPMTDADIDDLAGKRRITVADTVDFNTMDTVKGGLFDVGLTGGQGGTRWSAIDLAEPLPNPVMEEPIRVMLGLTKNRFRDILSGREKLQEASGGAAIQAALARLKPESEIAAAKEYLRSGRLSDRDKAVKRIGVLESLKKMGAAPKDLVLTKAPVLPPSFRPVSKMEGTQLVADANYLYRDLMEANENVRAFRDEFGDPAETRLDLYDAMKAVTGLGDPVNRESKDRGLKGLLGQVFGDSPKKGMFQRKVLSTNVDLVGRGVIAPDPDLDVDEIGMPVGQAWAQYKPFVLRGLVKAGMKATDAFEAFERRDPMALRHLERAMDEHPVLINRSPTLHKFNYTAHKPRIVTGDALRLPIPILAGHGADFDGDTANIHVVSSKAAAKEALDKMLPSKMLWNEGTGSVQMVPDQGFIGGLYESTNKPSDKPPVRFTSAGDAIRAYRSGELDIDDSIIIG